MFFNEDMAIEPVLLPADYHSDFISQQTKKDDVELVDSMDVDRVLSSKLFPKNHMFHIAIGDPESLLFDATRLI